MAEHGKTFPMDIGHDWNDQEKTRMILFIVS